MTRQEFQGLLTEYKDDVYGLSVYLLGRPQDAEDVTQEVYLRLWRAGDRIEMETAKWWLLRVTRNLCLDQLRRRKVREIARADAVTVLERGHVGIETEEDDRRDRSLEVSDLGAGALHTELALDVGRLAEAMESMKEPYRSALLLRELNDLSYEEIAETLSMSLANVKVTLHRARKKLRDAFLGENEVWA